MTADNGAMYSEKETVQEVILEVRQYPEETRRTNFDSNAQTFDRPSK